MRAIGIVVIREEAGIDKSLDCAFAALHQDFDLEVWLQNLFSEGEFYKTYFT